MPVRSRTLCVNGREVMVPKVAKGIAYASFRDLCEQPLGPGDYLSVAECFHTLVLAEIPRMSPATRDLSIMVLHLEIVELIQAIMVTIQF